MTLYEINDLIVKAIELGFDPETGEILDSSALDQLEMARNEKIENICLFIKDLNAEAKALKEEEAAMKARRTASEKKADSLKDYLQQMLAGEKFKTARCAVSYRKSDGVVVSDQNALPDEYIRRKVIEEPDKVALKEALKAGEEIPGAFLESRQNMILK